ncbi:hypothetical protein ABZY02_33055 [Streptomyces sp. NPDC006649]|uniref:hypothetical protein n=1 Tax=Streptomyces sp. NPDC006649 TaxID=3156896 RepID=UPI00339FA3CC
MKPVPPTVLTNAFYAFYDLHRPAYHAYAAAHLALEEAQLAVSHLFNVVAGNWTTVVRERHPAAWAWERHTRTIAHRSGHALTAAEEASLLHDHLLLSIDQIATATGTEPAAVSALLAAAHRAIPTGTARPRPRTAASRSTTPSLSTPRTRPFEKTVSGGTLPSWSPGPAPGPRWFSVTSGIPGRRCFTPTAPVA